jgi:DTW domain-containing protein YfiP
MSDTNPPAPEFADEAISPIDNRIAALILQHPQEQDHLLGTAQLTTTCLRNATLRIGLSWPSLAKALGRPADPKRWAILHLGSARPADLPKGREIVALDRRGHPLKDQDGPLARLEGVVLFDGTWSQAKTLWWRNPWVLKGQRVALNPHKTSLYGKLRREPRREGLSTIEAAGLILAGVEGRPEIETTLRDALGRMLDRYRATTSHQPRLI